MNKILMIIIYMLFVACKQNIMLSEEDKKYIPYRGNEVLCYSYKGITDTIFLNNYDNYFQDEHDSISNYTAQHYNILYNGNTFLVALTAARSNEKVVSFNIHNPDKGYFFGNSKNINELKEFKNEKFQLRSGEILNDVIKIPNRYKDNKSKNYIELLYWSSLKGLVGYAFSDSVIFRL